MDSITQAALGVVVGEAVLARKIGWRGAAWGFFFGTLPDLDVLAYPFLDEVTRVKWHRGLSHSIFMMIMASLVFAWPLARFHRKRGLTAQRAGGFVFLVWSTHVLIDVFTTYGTQIFEPFSDQRVAFNNFFIIDPLFTLPLLVCCGFILVKFLFRLFLQVRFQFFQGEELPPRSGNGAGIALIVSSFYVLFSFVMKIRATDQIEQTMLESLPDGELVAVAPTPLNTLLWRGLIETNEGYFVSYWSPFDKEQGAYDYIAKNRHLAASFKDEKLFQALKWFSRDHWVARQAPDGTTTFIDVRFGEVRDLSEKQLKPMFQWQMSRDEAGNFSAPSVRPNGIDIKAALGLLWERLTGKRERWEQMESY